MTIVVLFKCGKEIEFECRDCSTKYNTATGDLLNIHIEGATKNHVLYLQLDDISAVYQKGEIKK